MQLNVKRKCLRAQKDSVKQTANVQRGVCSLVGFLNVCVKISSLFRVLIREKPKILFSADNILCGACERNFTRVGSKCEECHSSSTAAGVWILFFVISFAWVGLLVFLGAKPSSTAKKKILFYFVQTLRVVLGPTSSW